MAEIQISGGDAKGGGDGDTTGGSVDAKLQNVGNKGGVSKWVWVAAVAITLILSLAYGKRDFFFSGLGIEGGNQGDTEEITP